MVTHGLAPRVLQSPVGPVVISDMTIGQIGLRDAHRWWYRYYGGSYCRGARGPYLTRRRGALDRLTGGPAQADNRLFTHTGRGDIRLMHAGRKASTLATWVKLNGDRTRCKDTSTAFANANEWADNGAFFLLL